ncbi:MAG TPA: GDSL-type esterase/lipase family protein [Kiritimatiellia bacterium]|nr:GDSL-type esterase/lipase family protein [Kiritimatiellia bacterium]HPS07915.1 GDSL-type esterase/lipase family protein [Kiritimatiellia bacterium]
MKRSLLMGLVAAGACLAAGIMFSGLRDRRPVLVCFGDSLTSCGGPGGHYSDWLAAFMPYVKVVDAGIGGDTLDGGRARYARDVLAHKPDVVLIALGANDFWRKSRTVAEMGADLEAMVRAARAGNAQVVVASCFGDRAFWDETCVEFEYSRYGLAAQMAQMEREVCHAHGCLYVPNMQVDVKPNRLPPFWDETDHPNRAGNKRVALRLMPSLRSALSRVAR